MRKISKIDKKIVTLLSIKFKIMEEQINNTLEVLRRGGVILYPTETIWGIGCDATNAAAVQKVFDIKHITDRRSMIVLVDKADNISRYVQTVPEVAWDLIELSDKPLTLVLPNGRGVAENLLPEDHSIGVRVTTNEFCSRLIHKLGRPLVSTSANITGEISPANFAEISARVKESVDYVVDPSMQGQTTGKRSSIIKLGLGGLIEILRD